METGDRRTHARLPKEARITCQEISYPLGSTPEVTVQMVDVSEGGVGIETPRAFDSGTVLQIALILDGWQRYTSGFGRYDEGLIPKPLTAVGRVVRCTPKGDGRYDVGVQFVDIWDDHWRAMRVYLEKERGS